MTVSDSSRRYFVTALLVGTAFIASAIAYPQLPAVVVTHWDAHGRPNGWSPRLFAVLILPAVMTFTGGILAALPPEPTPERRATRALIATITLLSMLGMHLVLLAVTAALITPAAMPRLIVIVMSLLFIGIGNYMPRVTERSPFVGVRFPWAYASDEVWRRTQRIGGYGMVAVGLLGVVAAIVAPRQALAVLIVATLVYFVALGIYSYHLSREA